MKVLAHRIVEELRKADHCAIYEAELEKFWPLTANRETKLTDFAQVHGFRLRFYKPGLCAIFDGNPDRSKNGQDLPGLKPRIGGAGTR